MVAICGLVNTNETNRTASTCVAYVHVIKKRFCRRKDFDIDDTLETRDSVSFLLYLDKHTLKI